MMNTPNYAAWLIPRYTPDEFLALSARDRLIHLCALAHLAPSTHNTQPWRFAIDESRSMVTVCLDRNAVLPASDAKGRQAVISIGCAIENMVVGAFALGLKPDVHHTAQPAMRVTTTSGGRPESSLDPLAVVMLEKKILGGARSDNSVRNLYGAILERKIMRAEFDPSRPIPPSVVNKLNQCTDGKRTRLHLITDAVRRAAIAEFQGQADGFVINSPSFGRELGDWLLANDTDSCVGMPGVGFGLKDAEARRIHEGLKGIIPLQPEDGLKFALTGKIGMEKSPLICCITTPKDDVRHWLDAGRAFERMFLTLESEGFGVAVHAGIVEVPLVTRMFGAMLGTLRRPMVLFRTGVVKDPEQKKRPHSPRRPIGEMIIDISSLQMSAC